QNRDGGIPTFCRGWTNLPFDRSSPDITAHALRAWLAWLPSMPDIVATRVSGGVAAALRYLRTSGESDGSWNPLWFGNQHLASESNPVYGTAKVTRALNCAVYGRHDDFRAKVVGKTELHPAQLLRELAPTLLVADCGTSGLGWLAGWTQTKSNDELEGSNEELALTVESLAAAGATKEVQQLNSALELGSQLLVARVEDGTWTQPAPIGFYFAKLWYYERLYPMVFTVAALEAVARLEAVAAGVPPAVEPRVPPGG
ncbi:MAG: hypothetical protein B9S33_07890, partial [Pedosphaera sp. Tous-C6FEB]